MPGKTFRQKPRSKNNKKSKKNHSNNKKSRKQLKGGMKASSMQVDNPENVAEAGKNYSDNNRSIVSQFNSMPTQYINKPSQIFPMASAFSMSPPMSGAVSDFYNGLEERKANTNWDRRKKNNNWMNTGNNSDESIPEKSASISAARASIPKMSSSNSVASISIPEATASFTEGSREYYDNMTKKRELRIAEWDALRKKEEAEDKKNADTHDFHQYINTLKAYRQYFIEETKAWVGIKGTETPQYKAILQDFIDKIDRKGYSDSNNNSTGWPWFTADANKVSDIMADPKNKKITETYHRYINQAVEQAKHTINNMDSDASDVVKSGFILKREDKRAGYDIFHDVFLPFTNIVRRAVPITYIYDNEEDPHRIGTVEYALEDTEPMRKRLLLFVKLLDELNELEPGIKKTVENDIYIRTNEKGELMKYANGKIMLRASVYFDEAILYKLKLLHKFPPNIRSYYQWEYSNPINPFSNKSAIETRNVKKIAAADEEEYQNQLANYKKWPDIWPNPEIERERIRKEAEARNEVPAHMTKESWELFKDLNEQHTEFTNLKKKNKDYREKAEIDMKLLADEDKKESAAKTLAAKTSAAKTSAKNSIFRSMSAKSDSSEKAGNKRRDRSPDDESTKEKEKQYKFRLEIQDMIQDTVDKMTSRTYLADLDFDETAYNKYKYHLRVTFNSKTETFNLDKDKIEDYLKQQFQNDSYYRYVYKNFLKKQKDLESDKKEYDKIGKGQKAFATLQADFEASRLKAAKEAAEQDKKSQAVSYEPNNLFNLPESKGIRHYLGEVRVSTDPKYFRQKPYFKHP